jgi:hypothetical protein
VTSFYEYLCCVMIALRLCYVVLIPNLYVDGANLVINFIVPPVGSNRMTISRRSITRVFCIHAVINSSDNVCIQIRDVNLCGV